MESKPTKDQAHASGPKELPFTMKKIPFNGTSKYLIDKFMIIGYDPLTIQKEIINYENLRPEQKTQSKQKHFFEHIPWEYPSVLTEIISDESKEVIDNNIIYELIFPKVPTVIILPKDSSKEQLTFFNCNESRLIFSLSPLDGDNLKKSYNGFALIKYELWPNTNSSNFYFPKIYFILSEFPYFIAFREIINKCWTSFPHVQVPMEIQMYNIVKFTPSPLNDDLYLSLGKPNDNGVWRFSYEEKLEDKAISSGSSDKQLTQNLNNALSDSEQGKKSVSSKEIQGNDGINTNSPQITQEKKMKKTNFTPQGSEIYLPKLSGYPFAGINMSIIFDWLTPDIIIEVFLFTFLEHDILFYCKNAEILNIIMHIFTVLNYPCNDSIYFWHIWSMSIESFMESTSTFVGKTCSTMTGINGEYNPDVWTTKVIKEHFVLDLENQEFFFQFTEKTSEVIATLELHKYIKNLLRTYKEKNKNKSNDQNRSKQINNNYFGNFIQELYGEIYSYSWKWTYNNDKKVIPNFFVNKNDINNWSCDKQEEIYLTNKGIQESFYRFSIKIFKYFFNGIGINSKGKTEDDNRKTDWSMTNKVLEDESTLSYRDSNDVNLSRVTIESKSAKQRLFQVKYEGFDTDASLNNNNGIFLRKFKDCSKYGTFLVNYLLYYETIDVYKIPWLFMDEFINSDIESDITLKYTKVIDDFYYSNTFEDIITLGTKRKNENPWSNSTTDCISVRTIKHINYYSFFLFYEARMKEYIYREYFDNDAFFVWRRLQLSQPTGKKYLFEIQQKSPGTMKILLRYISLLKEYNESELDEIFSKSYKYLKNNNLPTCRQSDIRDMVEQSNTSQSVLQIIMSTFMNLFGLTRIFVKPAESLDHWVIITQWGKLGLVSNMRKYLLMLLNVYKWLVSQSIWNNEKCVEEYSECYSILSEYIAKTTKPMEETIVEINNDITDNNTNLIWKKNSNENNEENNEYLEKSIPDIKQWKIEKVQYDMFYDIYEAELRDYNECLENLENDPDFQVKTEKAKKADINSRKTEIANTKKWLSAQKNLYKDKKEIKKKLKNGANFNDIKIKEKDPSQKRWFLYMNNLLLETYWSIGKDIPTITVDFYEDNRCYTSDVMLPRYFFNQSKRWIYKFLENNKLFEDPKNKTMICDLILNIIFNIKALNNVWFKEKSEQGETVNIKNRIVHWLLRILHDLLNNKTNS